MRRSLSILAILAIVVGILPFVGSHSVATAAPDDFYVYVDWSPDVGFTTGVNGYVDTSGVTGWGALGDEYIIFTGGPSYEGEHTAYIYRVETVGDPNMHPDNPEATGPIVPRTFTLVSSHYMGEYASGHDNAFYVDDTGIYYGASDNARGGVDGWGTFMGCGIYHWDFDWTPLGCVVPTPTHGQTLARNPATGDWWVGLGNRDLYRWDGASWVYQFTHPDLAGGHHDGMEIIGDSLFISDMTSDEIIQYRLDASGDPLDPPDTPYNRFYYSASPSVEGMGFGPNQHIWISGYGSGTIYEIGGGRLQPEVLPPGVGGVTQFVAGNPSLVDHAISTPVLPAGLLAALVGGPVAAAMAVVVLGGWYVRRRLRRNAQPL